MLDYHDAPVAWPGTRRMSAVAAPDDWLAVEEDDLHAAHVEACAMITAAVADEGARLRYARSIVVLEQLLAARAVVRARRIAPEAARAAFLGDRALGYLFGLAASGGDPTSAPVNERVLAAALRHVHGLVFGMAEAHSLTESCPIEVGAAFGDGLLAAEADLHGFLQAHDSGLQAALPTGLLLCLPWATCASGGDPTARPH